MYLFYELVARVGVWYGQLCWRQGIPRLLHLELTTSIPHKGRLKRTTGLEC